MISEVWLLETGKQNAEKSGAEVHPRRTIDNYLKLLENNSASEVALP